LVFWFSYTVLALNRKQTMPNNTSPARTGERPWMHYGQGSGSEKGGTSATC